MPTLNGVTKKMAEQSAEQKAAVELRSPEIRWTATSVSRPPNVLLESDLTYVGLAGGVFVYTAFDVDAYAGRIVGWTCSPNKGDVFARRAVRHAALHSPSEGNPLLGTLLVTAMRARKIRRFGLGRRWHRLG